jgi:hypothetical protein
VQDDASSHGRCPAEVVVKVELETLQMEFSDLDAGDVFLVEEDMLLKLDAPKEMEVNAVDLEDGALHSIDDDASVVHFPGATLHVEEPDDDDDD